MDCASQNEKKSIAINARETLVCAVFPVSPH